MRRGQSLYVALLLGLLAAVQLRALAMQFVQGFRPLSHAPTRVAYSWDMFAIRLDRCSMGWDPPLAIEGQRVARWHDRLPAVEFDTVFNAIDSYGAAAMHACQYESAPATHATMKCFSSGGEVREFGIDCP
jgi:hypothetical protein